MRSLTKLAAMPLALLLAAGGPPPKPAAPAAPDAPPPLAVAMPSAPARDAVRKLLLLPYATATATALAEPAWDGTLGALQALQSAHQADLALVRGTILAAGCRTQIFEKVDWTALDRDRYLPGATGDCGAGAYVSATILAWDRDKLPGTPAWGDFWDVAKHPGRRGLHRAARGNLEIALLADGVGAGDVYRALRTAEGVDRAFRKLDQLKPYIEWWDQPAQPAQLLDSAKVLLTTAPAAGLQAGPKLHLGTSFAGSLTEVTSWARLAGAPHPEAARAAIELATDGARQADFAHVTGQGPATKLGLALLPAAPRAASPSLPANQKDGLAIDEGFWLDNGEKLEARFAAWVGK